VGTIVETVDDLVALVGQHLGSSSWVEISQERVNAFADATDDQQWIHVDPERAAAGPFGGPIAHGYLTLSLLVPMWAEVLTVRTRSMAVNYGLNRVRFPAPVPVGSRIRLSATLASCEPVPGGVQIVVDAVVQREGAGRPVCVAQPIYRIYA
jgi:acyl dehydratase